MEPVCKQTLRQKHWPSDARGRPPWRGTRQQMLERSSNHRMTPTTETTVSRDARLWPPRAAPATTACASGLAGTERLRCPQLWTTPAVPSHVKDKLTLAHQGLGVSPAPWLPPKHLVVNRSLNNSLEHEAVSRARQPWRGVRGGPGGTAGGLASRAQERRLCPHSLVTWALRIPRQLQGSGGKAER